MKYGFMGAIVPILMEKPTFAYLNEAAPSIKSKAVKANFKSIIARQPEIGGMKNNLIMGLYLAAYLMAVYQTDPEKMSDDVFEGLVDHITKSKRFASMCEGKDFFTKKNMETRDRLQSDPEFNSYPENWKYTFSCDLGVPECTITYTRCAICEMARRENCFHLMRYLCTTDYAQQDLMGNTLIRTKTIGNGDDICDFHIIGKPLSGGQS